MACYLGKRPTVLIGVLASILLAYTPAAGDAILYQSEAEFFAHASIASTETFDGFATPTSFFTQKVEIDGVTYETDTTPNPEFPGNPLWTIGIHLGSEGFVSPPNDFGANFIGTNSLSFGSQGYVGSLGFAFLSPSTAPHPFVMRLTEINGQSTDFLVFSAQPSAYFGFTSDVGISSLTIFNAPGAGSSNYSFDNVSRSAINTIPEPATLLLLGTGLAGVGAIVRRRRKAKEE